VWIGTAAAKGYERVGRIADGWFPMMGPGPKLDAGLGVDRAEGVAAQLAAWADAGATHVSVNTMGQGLRTVDEHLAALAAVAAVVSAR
jgi:alkanesulfonate monooxygenase SsuD/methylene tetrahydromethanopterin reductase-like flavin-dependent oxidoreductase (luciferase family)